MEAGCPPWCAVAWAPWKTRTFHERSLWDSATCQGDTAGPCSEAPATDCDAAAEEAECVPATQDTEAASGTEALAYSTEESNPAGGKSTEAAKGEIWDPSWR